MTMRLARLLVITGAVLALGAQGASARTAHLSGGGTASISQVAMNVSFAGSGSASGSFECLMAGRSSFVLGAFGLSHIMQVHATPTAGSVSGSTAMFSGPGTLIMDGGQRAAIDVSVWADVATQRFQLSVVQVGAMPVETFNSGGIKLR
jgi:hypothetical protein